MNLAEYNYPIGIAGGFFNGLVPLATPAAFPTNYEIDFMRYIYYMCVLEAEGDYPIEVSYEVIISALRKKENNCKPRIKKILIGEAPPPTYLNYFYNSDPLRWNPRTGNPTKGQAWTSAIKTALFPGVTFPDTISFLKACAKCGFILLDLFPYNISYSGKRGRRSYSEACISAFGGIAPYPNNIINSLTALKCCLNKEIAIAFAMKSFGEIILNDPGCVANFNIWLNTNGMNLNPPGPIELNRLLPNLYDSSFLRVCGRRYLLAPCSRLLVSAGIDAC
jgi:hypothetical protein